jgi:hypothetical protein
MKVNAALFALCAASTLAFPTAISTPDTKAEVTTAEQVSPDYKSSQGTSSTAVPVLDVGANDKVSSEYLFDYDDDWLDYDGYLPDWDDFKFRYHNYSPKYVESLVDHEKYPLYDDDFIPYPVPHTGEEAVDLLMSPTGHFLPRADMAPAQSSIHSRHGRKHRRTATHHCKLSRAPRDIPWLHLSFRLPVRDDARA